MWAWVAAVALAISPPGSFARNAALFQADTTPRPRVSLEERQTLEERARAPEAAGDDEPDDAAGAVAEKIKTIKKEFEKFLATDFEAGDPDVLAKQYMALDAAARDTRKGGELDAEAAGPDAVADAAAIDDLRGKVKDKFKDCKGKTCEALVQRLMEAEKENATEGGGEEEEKELTEEQSRIKKLADESKKKKEIEAKIKKLKEELVKVDVSIATVKREITIEEEREHKLEARKLHHQKKAAEENLAAIAVAMQLEQGSLGARAAAVLAVASFAL